MQCTVLGSGAACPPAGKNSSGILISDQGRTVLLDTGHGVASALLTIHPNFDIDDIFITHMHADHFIDILALRFRVTRDMDGLAGANPRTTLHLPPGGMDTLAKILDAVTFPTDFCRTTFHVREYDPTETCTLGPLTIRFAEARHYIPAWAIRVQGSATLTYSGDTAPTDLVTELAQDTDLFLCEATLQEPETGPTHGHCTPHQAAAMAADARAKRLLLTHFWYGTDRNQVHHRAAQTYTGPLQIADDGLRLQL